MGKYGIFFSKKGKTDKKTNDETQPRKKHKTKVGRSGDLGVTGEANSSEDLVNEKGELIQRRYYNQNGIAEFDIDFKHGDSHNNHESPHQHTWDWRKGFPKRN